MRVHASIEPLIWESEFFQKHSAKLNFSDSAPLLQVAELDTYDLVQAKIPAPRLDWADALAPLGFRLVESEVDLSLRIGTETALTERLDEKMASRVQVATEDAIPALRRVAASAFALSRFRAPWYAPQDSGRFYALWVEKAVLGTFDHQCLLVTDSHGQPSGFVTLRDLQDGSARIGLLAAYPGTAGKGVGTKLMSAAKQWCQHRGLQRLHVATQMSNIAALRLYIRSGASVESTAYWLCRGRNDSI